MRGKLITFEGGEGSGKSTQAITLARRLESFGISVLLTREPGGSPGAEVVRHVLLSGAAKPFGPEAEAMLFVVARDDHIKQLILPALAAGKWIICDSTTVYQGLRGEIDQDFIKALERKFSFDSLHPDLTFVLDIPVALGLERVARRRGSPLPDHLDAGKDNFRERLRAAFLMSAAGNPERRVIIEASQTKEEMAKCVWDAVNIRLEPAMAPFTFGNTAS